MATPALSRPALTTSTRSARLILATSVAALLSLGVSVNALPNTWTNGNADALWDTGLNWTSGFEPTGTDNLIFPTPIPAGGGTITLTAGELADTLLFNDSYTLTGGDLSLTTGTVTVDPTYTATIASQLLGSSSLTKLGAGTLVLSASNSGFTGKTLINAGTLTIAADNNLGTAPGAAVADQLTLGGGTLKFSAVTTLGATRGITVTPSTASSIDVNNLGTIAAPVLISGILTGGGTGSSLTFTNSGTTAGVINLSGTSTLDAATTFNIDPLTTVSIGNNTTTAALSTGAINVNTNGTTATLRFNRMAGTTTFLGTIGGSGQVSVSNNTGNIVDLTSPTGNSYSGGTSIGGTNVTLRAVTDTAFGTGPVNIAGGGISSTSTSPRTFANNLNISGTTTLGQTTGGLGAITLNGNIDFMAASRQLTVNVATTVNGIISNGTGLSKSGAATLTLTNANTLTGLVPVGTGSMVLTGPNASLAAVTTIAIGDNNGRDESLISGSTSDVILTAGGLNRIGDTATLSLRQGNNTAINGPAAGSTGFTETIGVLENQTGFNTVTLTPASGQEVQLTAGTFSRLNSATLLVRGTNLGAAAGTADASRLVFTNPAGLGSTGGGGGAGTVTQNIVPSIIGDGSGTAGIGTGFVTYDSVNGVRLLTAAEYDNTASGTGLRNVSSAGGETVSTAAQLNSLRLTGGTLTTNATVRIGSGAILSTANSSITGSGLLEFGTTQGSLFTVANTTAITQSISTNLSGAAGLVLTSSGSANNITELGGINTRLTGGIVVNSGILRLANPTALNASLPNVLTLRTIGPGGSTTLRLNGNSVAIRDLSSGALAAGGTPTIENNSTAATLATLTDYQQTSLLYTGAINNGTVGTLAFVKSGTGNLTLQGISTYTAGTTVRGGALVLSGNAVGRLTGAGPITITDAATLRLTNTTGNVNTDRIPTQSINLRGGTLDYDNDASANVFTEITGALNLLSGANTVTVDKGNSITTNVSNLTFLSLARTAGATINFTSQNNNTAIFDLGATAASRLIFTSAPTLDDGIIGGYATIDSNATAKEFATYNSAGTISVTALPAASYTTALSSGANPAQNVKLSATPAALTSPTQINSLNLQQAGATTVALGTNVLRIESGGILVTGAQNATISGGIGSALTAGNGTNTAGDLVVHAYNGTIASSNIVATNTGDTLTKSGVVNGSPIIFTGTAPAGLAIGITYFAVNSNGTTFQVASTVGGAAIPITADSTTAAFTETTLVSIATAITDNGSAPVSFTKSGTGFVDLTGANTYSGPTAINGGTVRVNTDAGLGTAPAVIIPGALKLYGGTLAITGTTTLNANRSIEVGGTGTILIASGASGAGKTVAYNGSITSVAGTEGGLNILGTPTTLNVDPGKITGTLTALNVGGDFRFDAGTLTIDPAAATANVGRSLRIATDGTGSLTYTGAANTLTVGKGINELLDVGFVTTNLVTSPTLATPSAGTLNLNGLGQFTANVDQVRLGVGGANQIATGIVTLATNNDIVAGTSFVISTSGGQSQQNSQSSVLFGSGTNNVTTKSFAAGSLKGNGKATIVAGGTLSLQGFGANTLNMGVAQNSGNTGTTAIGLFDITGGTLNASFNLLDIANKNAGGAGGSQGTFTAGSVGNTINANSVSIASLAGGTAVTTGTPNTVTTTGTLNFGIGSFVINGDVAIGAASTNATNTFTTGYTSTGNLNITGGAVSVGGNVNAGSLTANNSSNAAGQFVAANGNVNVSGGTLTIAGNVNLAALSANVTTPGTVTSSATLNLTGGVTTIGSNVTTGVSTTGQNSNSTITLAGGTLDLTTTGLTDGTIAVKTLNAQSGTLMNVGQIFAQDGLTPAPLTKTTAGTLLLTGANTFTGPTLVSAGTLQLSGTLSGTTNVTVSGGTTVLTAGNVINDLASLSLAGGTFNTGGFSEGDLTTPGLASLSITSSSTLDFSAPATGGSQLFFAGVGAHPSGVLAIINWNGTANSAGGATDDRLVFAGSDPTAFSNLYQQSDVSFNGTPGYRAVPFDAGHYEIVAVPEPSSVALLGGLALLGLGSFRQRRSRRAA